MNYTEHHYRSHDGLQLYYRSYGSGDEVVVCLPGLTRNCKDFEELAGHLSQHWRVISPDLRGRGQSERDPKPARYHPGTYVGDIWNLLDDLHIDRFAVIGTSLGGLMAMIMADQQAHRLHGIVMNDIGPELPPAAVSRILQYAGRAAAVDDWHTAAAQAKQSYALAYPDMPDAFWDRFVRMCYRSTATGQLEPDVDPAVAETLRKSRRTVRLLRCMRRLGLLHRVAGVHIDPWDSFRAVTMPCLLVRGALSDVLTAEIAQAMVNVNPRMELITVPSRGHAPLLTEPDALEAVLGFLPRVFSSERSAPRQ